MSDEKVDVKKFAKGFIQPVEWWKATSTGIKIAIIAIVVIFAYRFLFSKTQTQKTQIGKVQGNVNIIQKSSRFLIPFMEGGIEKRTDIKYDTYIRAGVRFEF
jgi:hypothetical protein